MSDRKFDVEVLALPGSGLGRHLPAAMDVSEVAVNEACLPLVARREMGLALLEQARVTNSGTPGPGRERP
jgi:hypothetical protein